jgi:hypothetical protein
MQADTPVPVVEYLGEQRIPLLRVAGDAYSRGFQRGQALQAMVLSRVARAQAELLGAAGGRHADRITDRFERALEQHDPAVLHTLHGLADGAGIAWSDYRVAVMGAGGWFRLDCSVFAAGGSATRDGQLIMGKNGDLEPPFMAAEDVFVMEVAPDRGYRHLEMGVYPERACQPDGMNEVGLTVVGCGQRVSDGLAAYRDDAPVGETLYDVMQRIFATCATVDQALEILAESPRGYSGRTVIVGDAGGEWAKVELSYAQMAVFRPEPDRRHPGNHVCAAVSGTLSSPELRPLTTTIAQRPSSYRRHDRYMELLQRNAGEIDLDFSRALLRDTEPEPGDWSICKHGANATLESFIYLPQSRRVWACKGLPDQNAYLEVPFLAGCEHLANSRLT